MTLDDSLDIDPPVPQRQDMPYSIPKSDWLIIAVIGLLIQSIWLIVLEQPSYMDAYYYASNGERLAGGHGFSEMVIWQYLDDANAKPYILDAASLTTGCPWSHFTRRFPRSAISFLASGRAPATVGIRNKPSPLW